MSGQDSRTLELSLYTPTVLSTPFSQQALKMVAAGLVASVGLFMALNVKAIPTTASLDSSLSFLYQNDLNWTSAADHASSILVEPRSNKAAVAACASLSETLLPITGTHFTSDFSLLLSYLAFDGKYPSDQQFWVASASHGICQTITKGGHVSPSSCDRILPGLCSQSAPFRPASNQDKSSKWEVTVAAKDLTVTGYRDHLSFRFLGLPYANAPQRFTYSTLYSGAQKIFNATDYGSQCVQAGGSGSEDCLFLNIFTPFIPKANTPSSQLKPVLFHIHGGAFTGGTANDGTFDGGNIASRGDIVVVDINYRLSTLGFLALEDGVTNGNFGIGDMTVALDWVQKYISTFGGDPSKVTIMGQSAGAAATRALLASPKAIGKFSAAVPMSNLAGENYATTYSLYYTIPQLQTAAVNGILSATGCNKTDPADVPTCLRAVDPNTLVNLPTVARFIVIDGTYVTSKQLPVDGTSPVAKVPVMMGFMRDDGAAFIGYPSTTNVTSNIASVLSSPSATAVQSSGLFQVPSGTNTTLNIFNVTARITTDVEFRCLDQAAGLSAVKHNVFPKLWMYQFDRSYQTPGFDPNAPVCDAPITATHPHGDPSQEYFKCHSGELYFVWGTLGQFSLPFRDENDLPFSQFAQDTWVSFIRTHDPNPSQSWLEARGYTNTLQTVRSVASWDPLSARNDKFIRLMNIRPVITAFEEEAQCNFLDLPFTYYG